MTENTLTHAVLPLAGLATRMLPASKTVPKEMFPVLDRPVLHYVIAEAQAAGIRHFVFVTRQGKEAIAAYFDRDAALEARLAAEGKDRLVALLRQTNLASGQVSFVRQQDPKGLGDAVLCARDVIGARPFAVLLPDMLTRAATGESGCMAQLAAAYARHGGNWLSVAPVAREDVSSYGIVGVGASLDEHSFAIDDLVEKPEPAMAPSNLMVLGRYILEPAIFDYLAVQEPGSGGERQITDAMRSLLARRPFYGHRFTGAIDDCGTLPGWLEANINLAMDDPQLRGRLVRFLRRFDKDGVVDR